MGRIAASADVFRAVADPTRRAILDRLRGGRAHVNALAAEFDQSRPAISKHLKVLRDARLVHETRVGRERLYQLDPMPLQRVAGWIEGYRSFWTISLDNLKRRLEEE
jgi:DNA-binding transcriptional ArsR family regulator